MSEGHEHEHGHDHEHEQDNGWGPDLMTLVDEEGEEHAFELVDSAEFEGKEYVALVPVLEESEDEEEAGELIILKLVNDGGEEFLEAIEDEGEFGRVGEFFMERLSDTFDFENS